MNRFLTGFLFAVLIILLMLIVLPRLWCHGGTSAPRSEAYRAATLANMNTISIAIEQYVEASKHLPDDGTEYMSRLLEDNIIKKSVKDA